MIQFVSNNLNDLNIQYVAMEGLVVPKAGFVADYSFVSSVSTIGSRDYCEDSRSADHWADIKVKFQRDLRTRPFIGGELWIEPHHARRQGFILMATRRNEKQISLPLFRLALRKLSRWADRNQIASVALHEIGKGVAISDTQIRELLYQHLGQSRCQFWAEENGFEQSEVTAKNPRFTIRPDQVGVTQSASSYVNANPLKELPVQSAGLLASRFGSRLRESMVASAE